MLVLHPRPGPIAAAMYTLRDLDVEAIVLHGPSGCCFGPARLLERDGVRVFTTALSDNEIVFGGEERLSRVLRRIDEAFRPRLIGLVGTCTSMIIGENLRRAAEEAGVADRTICCNIHNCAGDNTVGAIEVLREALGMGLISKEEFERQRHALEMATRLERTRGTARMEYLPDGPGDDPKAVAREVVKSLRNGERIACVLNAKKETAFLFADLMLALAEARDEVGGRIEFVANLDPNVGLPRIRGYSKTILEELSARGIHVDLLTGGLDEYPVTGERAREAILSSPPELAVIAGVPHAVAVEGRVRTIAVTSGSRATSNLKSLGYDYAVNEPGAHRVSLGREKRIRRSLLGSAIRKAAREGL